MVGLVFSKLSRPQYRCKTIIFSNQAVITVRNKKLCLIIRVGDLRDDNFILGTQISAKLLRRRVSSEGEVYQEMHNLVINPETTSESCIFFVWPLDIVHIIDENSPFYEMSEADFASEGFEIILVMEGMNETSNMIFQARYFQYSFGNYSLYRNILGPLTYPTKFCGATDLSRCSSIAKITISLRLISLHFIQPMRWTPLCTLQDKCTS